MTNTLKLFLLLSCALIFQGCAPTSTDSGGGSSTTSNANTSALTSSDKSIYGTWDYVFPGSTNANTKSFVATFNEDGTVQLLLFKGSVTSTSVNYIFRKSLGTFSQNGSLMTFKYSYETCSPVGQTSMLIFLDKNNPDVLIVSKPDASSLFSMRRLPDPKNSDLTLTLTEDLNCNQM